MGSTWDHRTHIFSSKGLIQERCLHLAKPPPQSHSTPHPPPCACLSPSQLSRRFLPRVPSIVGDPDTQDLEEGVIPSLPRTHTWHPSVICSTLPLPPVNFLSQQATVRSAWGCGGGDSGLWAPGGQQGGSLWSKVPDKILTSGNCSHPGKARQKVQAGGGVAAPTPFSLWEGQCWELG